MTSAPLGAARGVGYSGGGRRRAAAARWSRAVKLAGRYSERACGSRATPRSGLGHDQREHARGVLPQGGGRGGPLLRGGHVRRHGRRRPRRGGARPSTTRGASGGRATIGYQVTQGPAARPRTVELTRTTAGQGRRRSAVDDIPLIPEVAVARGRRRVSIIKGRRGQVRHPHARCPAVTAFGEVGAPSASGTASGPVMLRGVVFTGELYPLEDDPGQGQAQGRLRGARRTASCTARSGPTSVWRSRGCRGRQGRRRDHARGCGSAARAAWRSTPTTTPTGSASAAEAYATGQLTASATVDLVADLYAA